MTLISRWLGVATVFLGAAGTAQAQDKVNFSLSWLPNGTYAYFVTIDAAGDGGLAGLPALLRRAISGVPSNQWWLLMFPVIGVLAAIVLAISVRYHRDELPFPMVILIFLSAFGNFPAGNSQATAVLRFSGLPPGVSVVSCQSYNVPVPAQAATWGRVKSVYR